MAEQPTWSPPTRHALPLILIRGFGGLGVEDEKRIAYQGFNDGTVYPRKRGENYIYEGMILRFMKSDWRYEDATNVVGYFPSVVQVDVANLPGELQRFDKSYFTDDKVVIDAAMALHLLKMSADPCKTLWVFRYYDLDDRKFPTYGRALARLIDFIRDLAMKQGATEKPKVNIIAHSMGGLLARYAAQVTYPSQGRMAHDHINKIVTLGTPHQGISFQFLADWIKIDAEKELEAFNPKKQKDPKNEAGFTNFWKHFPLERLLTIVGTNYRSYNVGVASWMNRLFSVTGEGGANYNRSDGLVKQAFAQIPGAPRSFVHKCHGGFDSLVTSREAFEIATRFFFGNKRVRLRLLKARVKRGRDMFGRSEFFLGVSAKPRAVDFDLFHQSAEAENCYGPFHNEKLDDARKDVSFWWADDDRLVAEIFLDTSKIKPNPSSEGRDLVFRLDFYVGERDVYGVGFSDNVIFRKQYYVRALIDAEPPKLFLHDSEQFQAQGNNAPGTTPMTPTANGWSFDVTGTGFDGTFGIEIDHVPEVGLPERVKSS